MALILTLREGQGFRLDTIEYRVSSVRGGQDFDLHTQGQMPIRIRSTQWAEIVPGRAWVMAADSRRRGGKEVGVMVDAPDFNVTRCVD